MRVELAGSTPWAMAMATPHELPCWRRDGANCALLRKWCACRCRAPARHSATALPRCRHASGRGRDQDPDRARAARGAPRRADRARAALRTIWRRRDSASKSRAAARAARADAHFGGASSPLLLLRLAELLQPEEQPRPGLAPQALAHSDQKALKSATTSAHGHRRTAHRLASGGALLLKRASLPEERASLGRAPVASDPRNMSAPDLWTLHAKARSQLPARWP